jgi:hypothetical protein
MDWFVEGVVGEAPWEGATRCGSHRAAQRRLCVRRPHGRPGLDLCPRPGPPGLEAMGVETAYAELVAEGPDSLRVIRDFAEKGYDIIFATSFGYMDSVIAVAEDYPDTYL